MKIIGKSKPICVQEINDNLYERLAATGSQGSDLKKKKNLNTCKY